MFNTRFESASQIFSPVSNYNDNESTVLSNSYTAIHSPSLTNPLSMNQMNDHLLNGMINQSPNQLNTGNQPRRSFHRYAHQFSNVNILEKRRKQQEYQAQLEAQIADKRQETKIRKQEELSEDKRLDKKIINEQAELRKEFEMDHKGKGMRETMKDEVNLRRNDLSRNKERKLANLNNLTNLDKLERLESKSKELIKVFKEASTQTEAKSSNDLSIEDQTRASIQKNDQLNKWHFINSSNDLHPVPVKSNRSAILRTSNSRPKWTKKSSNSKGNYFF